MIDAIIQFAIDIINADYILLMETLAYFSFLDSPGTYVMMMIAACVMMPVLYKSVYNQYTDPHGYYSMSLTRKIVIGLVIIAVLLSVGYFNFIRFIPAV